MGKMLKYTHENGIDHVLVGDYDIPMLTRCRFLMLL